MFARSTTTLPPEVRELVSHPIFRGIPLLQWDRSRNLLLSQREDVVAYLKDPLCIVEKLILDDGTLHERPFGRYALRPVSLHSDGLVGLTGIDSDALGWRSLRELLAGRGPCGSGPREAAIQSLGRLSQVSPAPRRDVRTDCPLWRNSIREHSFDPSWRTEEVLGLARRMAKSEDFISLGDLADALEDAGCADADVLESCRGIASEGEWVVHAAIGKL